MKRHVGAADLYSSLEADGLDGAAVAYLKREFSTAERQSAADSGAALPDGSFPIHNKTDLRNAIQAIGRAKNRARAMAHIKTRARALGATDMLPDTWKSADADARKQATIDKALEMAVKSIVVEHSDATDWIPDLVECFKQFRAHLDGKETDMPTITVDEDKLAALVGKAVDAALEKRKGKVTGDSQHSDHAEPDADDLKRRKEAESRKEADADADADAEADARKMLQDVLAKMGKPEGFKRRKDAEVPGDQDADDEHEDAVPGHMRHRRKEAEGRKEADADAEARKRMTGENDMLRKRIAALEEDKRIGDFNKRAVTLGLAESDGKMLLKAHRGDPEALKWMEDQISALHKRVDAGEFYKEFGYRGDDKGGTAHDALVAKAQELRKREPKLTAEQAYAKVYEDPDNNELAKREQVERERKIYGKS